MENDGNVVFNNQQPAPAQPDAPIPVPQPTSSVTEQPVAGPSPLLDGGPPRIPGGGIIKKIIIGVVVLVILVLIAVFFMSRGQGNKKVKLTWWGLWESPSVMAPLIADFQKEHPNITVEYIMQDPKQYREKLQTRIKNGEGPDIFRFHNTWVPMIAGDLLPLSSDVITPDEFKKNFYPVMQEDLIQNGGIYGIPLGADTLSLFVNTELLNSAGVTPPETWDDFVKTAAKITVKDGTRIKTAGAALGTYGNITHAPDIISLLFIQQGINIRKFPNPDKPEEDKLQKAEVLDFYTFFAKGDSNVWDATLDESILSFARGNLAMYIGFSWDILRIQALNKDLKFSIHPVPQLVGRKASLASYWVEGVSSKSPNQKEALLFMQYLSKKETAQKLFTTISKSRIVAQPYARRDLTESLKDNELLYPFVAQLGYAKSSYFSSNTNDGTGGINFLNNNYLGDAINSIINDSSSSQTVVETLDQGTSQVFQKYGIN